MIKDKALTQPEQEPVAFICEFYADEGYPFVSFEPVTHGTNTPLYTTPPQRKPLTDEQTIILKDTTCPEIDWKARHGVEMNNGERNQWMLDWFRAFKVAIEAAHGIKENT